MEKTRNAFVNSSADNAVEITDTHVAVTDWSGMKHFYNEDGEYSFMQCSPDPKK